MEFNLQVFILQLATFIVGMWLSKLIFLPYLKGWMSERQRRIEDQLATAEKRQKDAEALKSEFENKVKELEQNTTEILQRTRQEATKGRDEVIQMARKEAELILSDARKAIESERQEVTQALQKEVGALAVAIAEKILRTSVDTKAQEKLVQEGVKELGARKN
ncbi:MAG TPA: F0F1 ATP synthase subunit B [bacterium]|nr:F0F1 ATP synthase subunit B [bacterium]